MSRSSSSRKWHETGIDSKRTVHIIANPIEGLMGVQREVGNPAHLSARSGSAMSSRVASARSQDGIKQQVGRISRAGHSDRAHDEKDPSDHPSSRSSGSSSDSSSGEQGSEKKEKKFMGMVWKDYDDLPDLPKVNFLNWSRSNPFRRKCASLALNPVLDNFWMLCAVAHCLIVLPEFEDFVFGCKMSPRAQKKVPSSFVKECAVSLPGWHHFFFLVTFWVELLLKMAAFGLTGGKFAYWTQDFYNKFDIVSTVAYVPEILVIVIYGESQFSCRAFRLIRLLKPLGQTAFFSDLETIFYTFGEAMKPVATVLSLIGFVLIMFAIIGMEFYGKAAFRRRCVWADTMDLKIPEQFCELGKGVEFPGCTAYGPLNPLFFRGPQQGGNPVCMPRKEAPAFAADFQNPELGLDTTCGPFQLCLDRSNPNNGFTSFDSLQNSLITLIQVMSGDSDVQVLWASIGSNNAMRPATVFYYLIFGFLVIHVLINVLVAVFANVFATARTMNEEKIERRRAGQLQKTGSSTSPSSGFSSSNSSSASSSSKTSGRSGAARSSSAASRSGDSKRSRQSTSRERGRGDGAEGKFAGKELADTVGGEGSVGDDVLHKNEGGESEDLRDDDLSEEDIQADKELADVEAQLVAMQEAEKEFEVKVAMARARKPYNKPTTWVLSRLKAQVDPSLQSLFIFLFRNRIFDSITFIVIIIIGFCLCGKYSCTRKLQLVYRANMTL